MRFKKFGSKRTISVDINKYRIDWSGESVSKLQTAVKLFLKTYWHSCIVLEEFRIPGSKLRCDFINLNKKIAIEVHGEQHFKFNPFFHNQSRTKYFLHIKRDINKYKWLEANGFKVIELNDEDVGHLSLKYIREKFGVDIL